MINDEATDVVLENAVESCTYDEFIENLPEDDCRYYVFDFEYDLHRGEGPRSKVLLLVWFVSLPFHFLPSFKVSYK